MAHIQIYTSLGCAFCVAAKRLLTSLGATYEEITLWDKPDLAEEIQKKYQWMTVPMIVINGEFIGGYDDLMALHTAGTLQTKLAEAPRN